MNKQTKKNLWRMPVLLVIFAVYLSPFYILFNISLKPVTDLSSHWKFPGSPTLDNFRTAIEQGEILSALLHSFFIMAAAVFLIVVVSSLAAYPLARNRSRLNRGVKSFILGIMMVPPLSILVPLYSVLVDIGGINKYWGIILTLLTFELPMAIFPVVVCFLFLQKYFIKGMVDSAVK